MMTTLILLRHGETEKNVVGKLHSAYDPEPLTSKGRKQTKKTAEVLKGMNISLVYTSKENRAQESAKIVSESLNILLKKVTGLQERDWGEFSGKSWDEIKAVLDPMTLEERFNYVPSKGESWKDFEERLIKAINQIIKVNAGKTIVVVSHGGAIRALMPYLLGVPKEESFKYDPDNASLTIFEYSKGKFENKKVNDTSHLKK